MATLGLRKTEKIVDLQKYLQVIYTETPEDVSWASRNPRWLRTSDASAFVKVELLDEATSEVLLGGERKKVAAEDLFAVCPPNTLQLQDMSELTQLSDACVLQHVRARYERQVFQTFSGLFLVVVNPYTDDVETIYSHAMMLEYQAALSRTSLPPHIFAVAEEAYKTIRSATAAKSESHCILCTGESGAGKTENTKKIIAYLANCATGPAGGTARADTVRRTAMHASVALSMRVTNKPADGLKQQLQNANPALEAFGNAATLRNDNSSRFGKLIKIFFDSAGYVASFACETYLLEKTRVVRQAAGERNFHIFYQVLAGLSDAELGDLELSRGAEYRYLGRTRPAEADEGAFHMTKRALNLLCVPSETQRQMWRVIAGILHLGQISVEENPANEQAYLAADGESTLLKAATALGIGDRVGLHHNVLMPKMSSVSTATRVGQTRAQVLTAIDSVAKSLYQLLFLYIVRQTSQIGTGEGAASFVGLLDIAGFEVFETNSLEQLCINFVNEKLQGLFNARLLVKEQSDYEAEGIVWTKLDFEQDISVNRDTIALFEHDQGVFALLDTACRNRSITDNNLVDQLFKLPAARLLSRDKIRTDAPLFTVRHYAGQVTYTAIDFIAKNSDKVNHSVLAQLRDSSVELVRLLYSDEFRTSDARGAAAPRPWQDNVSMAQHTGSFSSATSLVKKQMRTLLETLDASKCSFVRCIVPNRRRAPWSMDARLVHEQLQCNGVIPGLKICKGGFPSRKTYVEFHLRYRLLATGRLGRMEAREACNRILADQAVDESQFRLGLTQIFFKEGVLYELERRLSMKHTPLLLALVVRCKGYVERIRPRPRRDQDEEVVSLQVPAAPQMSQATQRELEEIRSQNLKFQEEVYAALTSRAALEIRLEESERQRAALQGQVASLSHQNQEIQQDLEEQTQAALEFQSLAQEARVRADGLARQVEDLEALRDRLAAGASATEVLEEQLAAAEEESSRLRGLVARLESERDEALREQRLQVTAHDALTADKARLTALVSRLQGEAVAVRGSLDTAQQELTTLRKTTKDAAQAHADLAGKLATQTNLAEALERQLAVAKGTIMQLEKDHASQQRLVADRDADIKELTMRVAAFSKGATAAEAELERVSKGRLQELIATKEKLDEAAAQLAETRRQLAVAVDNSAKQQDQIVQLEERLREARQDLEVLGPRVTLLEKETRAGKAREDGLLGTVQELELSVADLKARNKQLEASSKATLEQMKRSHEALGAARQQDIADLRARCEARDADCDNYLRRLAAMETLVATYRAAAQEAKEQAEAYKKLTQTLMQRMHEAVQPSPLAPRP